MGHPAAFPWYRCPPVNLWNIGQAGLLALWLGLSPLANGWRTWTGAGYRKVFHEARLPDGEVVRCWPNAGKLIALDLSGRIFGPGECECREAGRG